MNNIMVVDTEGRLSGMAADNMRRQARRRILKTGIVAFNDRHSTLPCTVRDLSESGARLRVESSLSAPDAFALLIELDGIEADCTVAWRTASEIGVKFSGALRKLSPKRLQVVRAYVPPKPPSLRRLSRNAKS